MTVHIPTDEQLISLKTHISALDQLAQIDTDPEEMRRIGYQAIDAIVEHLSTLKDRPTGRKAERAEMEKLLREPLPKSGVPFEQLLEDYREKILHHAFHLGHPRFFAYIPSSPTYAAILADALATAANLFLGNWLEASAAAEIEIIVIDWFKEMIGLTSAEAGGLLTSGGSVANLTALAVARQAKLNDEMDGAVIYASDQTHSSVERAARIIGFRREQYVYLPTDELLNLDFRELERRITEDKRAGRRPFCLIANGGTTNTGAVDALDQAAEIAREHNLWLHVDAAYGGFAALTERGRRLLKGIERADSVTLDPHKWLYAPFEAGCVIFKNAQQSRATFHLLHDYLQDMPRERENVNFYDYGIQLTRGFRALKLWMALRFYGIETYRALIDRSLDLAQLAALLMRRSRVIEVFNQPQLGVVCFRYVPAGFTLRSDEGEAQLAKLNAAIVERVIASGEATMSSTRLHRRFAIRFCVLNHRTQVTDVERAVALVERLGNEVERV
jgi:glutamate/tyrosine decarboxylase-like PLP-dependent enzyme